MKRRLTARSGELEGAETDIVEGLIVKNHTLIRVFNKLVNRECGIVRLNYSVRYLWRWKHRKCEHHAIRILFPYLGNQ